MSPGSRPTADAQPVTPDGRYLVVRGRLWRRSGQALSEAERQTLVEGLMSAFIRPSSWGLLTIHLFMAASLGLKGSRPIRAVQIQCHPRVERRVIDAGRAWRREVRTGWPALRSPRLARRTSLRSSPGSCSMGRLRRRSTRVSRGTLRPEPSITRLRLSGPAMVARPRLARSDGAQPSETPLAFLPTSPTRRRRPRPGPWLSSPSPLRPTPRGRSSSSTRRLPTTSSSRATGPSRARWC